MNELELIARCLKKEKPAWDAFVQKYSKVIYWAIRKRLSLSGFKLIQDDIDGIFQESFLVILENDKLRQLKDPQIIPGWLAMIASNKAVDFMRRRIRQDRRLTPDIPVLKDDSFRLESRQRDLKETIKSAINSLSAKARLVISFNLLDGRTHQQIAVMMNMSVNTVSTIIARAKQKLKQDLQRKGIKDL